ncbi:Uncharacterized protein SCF082_LOCUS38198 [Durusdinium trenchii]|uniref:Uncharacterized protein n=1 Tax=Durusdinium trenchii TaxID=1381693 RepID=A0ABP0PVP0_9DINO
MSVKGKAAFCFGPEFHHGPPPFGSFSRWPNIFGISRIDMPRIGDEEILQLYKERQATHCHLLQLMIARKV